MRAQQVLIVLVDAGADRLDELEVAGDVDLLVAPHHRHDQHVRVRQRLRQLIGVEHLQVADAGGAGREALGHAVGAVGKADGELVFGRKHG